jgi:hypothetical protein
LLTDLTIDYIRGFGSNARARGADAELLPDTPQRAAWNTMGFTAFLRYSHYIAPGKNRAPSSAMKRASFMDKG